MNISSSLSPPLSNIYSPTLRLLSFISTFLYIFYTSNRFEVPRLYKIKKIEVYSSISPYFLLNHSYNSPYIPNLVCTALTIFFLLLINLYSLQCRVYTIFSLDFCYFLNCISFLDIISCSFIIKYLFNSRVF